MGTNLLYCAHEEDWNDGLGIFYYRSDGGGSITAPIYFYYYGFSWPIMVVFFYALVLANTICITAGYHGILFPL